MSAPTMCILTSLDELPPRRERSCTSTTSAPCRAAATAAHTPAIPPPAINKSQARSTSVMFGSPANRSELGRGGAIASYSLAISSCEGVFDAPQPLRLTKAEYEVDAAASLRKSRRFIRGHYAAAPGYI